MAWPVSSRFTLALKPPVVAQDEFTTLTKGTGLEDLVRTIIEVIDTENTQMIQ